MADPGLHFIGGDWVPGEADDWERISPADGTPTWRGRWATTAQTAEAIIAARAALATWSATELEQRIAVCRRFADYVSQRKHELARLIAVENGKPHWEAMTEVAASVAKVNNSVAAITQRRWTTSQQLGDFNAVTRYRPHGVMFVIGPYNFPAHIPGGHIIPALLAGNTLVFKPSEWVPATATWLVRAWQSAGLPDGVLNLVVGAAETGRLATEHPAVDGILFTGSQKVGTELHRRLAGRPDKVLALEMGGNNPLVVHNASDTRGAAVTTILSAYITSGQRCTCTRRLIVTGDANFERLRDELVRLLPSIRVGLSFDEPQPFLGPMIHARAAQQMLDTQSELVAGGDSSTRRYAT